MEQNGTLFEKFPPHRDPTQLSSPSAPSAVNLPSDLSAPLRPNGEFRQHVDEIVDLLFQDEIGYRHP